MIKMLFAKLKDEHRSIFTDEEVEKVNYFSAPDITNEIEFDCEVKLNTDEWFYICVDENHQHMVAEYIENIKNTVGTNYLKSDDFSDIKAVYKVFNDNCIWQKITPSKNLVPKHILTQKLKLKETPAGLEISENVDAYYNAKNKRLYFRSFSRVRSLFKDMDDYYSIASEQEIKDFKENGICVVTDGIKFGERNQKTLKIILDDKNIDLNDVNFRKTKLPQLIKDFGNNQISLNDNGQVQVVNNKELTILLTILSGRRYKNPVTDDLTEATHTKKV